MIKFTSDWISSTTFKGLWGILRRSPHLQSLYFRPGFKYYPENGIEELLYQMPSCFLTELTKISVKFRNGIGGPEELFMVGIFLKKVVASREMVILFPEDCVGEENLLESLSKFPKGSKKCRISLQSQPMGRDWKILWD
ncbi:uncharacterized protein LOC116189888 [Punica granatum]|uniref:Uncharacterized protein LOC116189888 n=1 Tax=Punica granatum TaxID=22663 RepID=A0A6P8C289_PUNGR|nr:uncharacterized protein LOC116189888 [Punica granatum]